MAALIQTDMASTVDLVTIIVKILPNCLMLLLHVTLLIIVVVFPIVINQLVVVLLLMQLVMDGVINSELQKQVVNLQTRKIPG